MDRLRCVEIFVEVAKGMSFSAAARRLGISRAAATKGVAQLEELLGAQLLVRSTRAVNLTEAGRRLLTSGQNIVLQYASMEELVRASVHTHSGSLTIGSPPPFAELHLMPLVSEFLNRNPDVDIKLHLDYGHEDLIEAGLDLTIRVTPALKDTSLVAQKITELEQVLVASPQYVEQWGEPKCPDDLPAHRCLVHLLKSPNSVWSFTHQSFRHSVQVSGPLRANFGEVLRQAALMHQGISMHPKYMVLHDVQSERLKILMPEYHPDTLDVYAVYPSRRHMPMRVRSFINFMKRSYAEC